MSASNASSLVIPASSDSRNVMQFFQSTTELSIFGSLPPFFPLAATAGLMLPTAGLMQLPGTFNFNAPPTWNFSWIYNLASVLLCSVSAEESRRNQSRTGSVQNWGPNIIASVVPFYNSVVWKFSAFLPNFLISPNFLFWKRLVLFRRFSGYFTKKSTPQTLKRRLLKNSLKPLPK